MVNKQFLNFNHLSGSQAENTNEIWIILPKTNCNIKLSHSKSGILKSSLV